MVMEREVMAVLWLESTPKDYNNEFMGKGKPRHNPDKPANKYGKRCPYWEEYINGTAGCEGSELSEKQLKCNGNRHNCVKVKYHTAAILKEL